MKNLATFRDAGSLTAGALVGLSLVVAVFAMTVADPGASQLLWVVVAPVVLGLGLVLQAVLTRPRQRHANDSNLAGLGITNLELAPARPFAAPPLAPLVAPVACSR